MSTESLLLSRVIQNAPSGAIWIISSDSWPGILDVLRNNEVVTNKAEWQIKLKDSNIVAIAKLIADNELGRKIVHTYLIDSSGFELFSALDAMSMIVFDEAYGVKGGYRSLFPEIEIYYK